VGARPAELASLERAIDGLLARVGDALAREKRFTQEASHELRTPLTLLRVRIEHLTQHLADRPALGGEAQEALRDVESLDRLVEALLLLARSESAGLPSTPVNLCDIAREAAARQIRALGKDGWTLEVTAPDEILVRGSEELLARAVSNLIENARKFGGDRPRVRVRVLEESGRGVIAVDDDGPGILPELRPLVFERFVRGPAERNRVPGVGLGLAVVRAVAERHGGDVSAGAGPLGGEEIRISIPLLRAAEPAAALG
jgi:signal transduction histidine kinase